MASGKLFPRWLRSSNLVPRWMGQVDTGEPNIATPEPAELIIKIIQPDIISIVTHGGATISTLRNWAPGITEFQKKKITAKVNFITLEHGEDIHRVTPDLKKQTFLKPKYPPTAQLNGINFEEITND